MDKMSSLASLLPQEAGMLPTVQLVVASMALSNTLQNFFSLYVTRRLYEGKPDQVTPLQARTSAVWNSVSVMVRIYCAYNVHSKAVYEMTMWTYALAFAHFVSETAVFGTGVLNVPMIIPLCLSSGMLFWMWSQYAFYVQL